MVTVLLYSFSQFNTTKTWAIIFFNIVFYKGTIDITNLIIHILIIIIQPIKYDERKTNNNKTVLFFHM